MDNEEWNYRYDERIGIMCGSDEPTAEQHCLALKEADEAVKNIAERCREV